MPDAGAHGAAAFAAPPLERVEHQVGVGPLLEWPGAELLDELVERARQARDLALRHPLDPELPDELLNPPGEDPGQLGVGDHRHERPLRPPAGAERPVGEVGARAQLRHRELDRPDPGVPVALAVAVAAVDPLRRALPVGGAAEGLRLGPIRASAKSFTIARSRSGLACSSCLRSHSETSIVLSTTVLPPR